MYNRTDNLSVISGLFTAQVWGSVQGSGCILPFDSFRYAHMKEETP